MNKTVFTGVNAETCILIKPDPEDRWIHGEVNEVCDLLGEALTQAVVKNPHMRRPLFRSMWRVWKDTLPEVFAYWIDGWPITLAGVVVLFALLELFAAIMKALGA